MAGVKHGRRRRGYTRLSAKHQVTIPISVLEETGLCPGDELKVEANGSDQIVLSKSEAPAARRLRVIEETAGSMPGVWKPGGLDRLRDEWR
jgi:bifunctional DNA-binding transcriptional regulator/antitoxin component of YhaV-PrlF toxin-antitoxin module